MAVDCPKQKAIDKVLAPGACPADGHELCNPVDPGGHGLEEFRRTILLIDDLVGPNQAAVHLFWVPDTEEHLEEHPTREKAGKLAHKVAVSLFEEPVDQLRHDRPDPRLETRKGFRR